MGIPLYFKTISKNFPETIISDLNQILKSDSAGRNLLYFDLNCLIHPCCRNILKLHNSKKVADNVLEKRMLNEIIDYMKKLIDLVNPEFIFIAIDGVAPFAKMVQQRERRYKSALTREIDDNMRAEMGIDIPNHWDTNAISPGTKFMESLYNKINIHIKNGALDSSSGITRQIIFSSAKDPGEGEHKILDHIRNSGEVKDEDKIIVYGLDADLIMLSLSSGKKQIYLLREALQFNTVIKDKFLLLDIDFLKFGLIMTLKEHILDYDSCYIIKDIDRIIDDYIFLCYFLGNDFVPHIPGISLKDNGHDLLLKNYIAILVNYGDYLVDRTKMRINYSFLASFTNKLGSNEKELYMEFTKKRHKQRPTTARSDDPYEHRQEIVNNLPITDPKNQHLEREINLGRGKYKSKYYKICFQMESMEEVDEVCANYVTGLKWVFEYYFKGCSSWHWKYNYRHPPLISDLANYLSKSNINHIKFKASKPFDPITQLMYILPKKSKELVPIEFQSNFSTSFFYPDYYAIDMIFKRFFWQCPPILPNISIKELKKMSHIAK